MMRIFRWRWAMRVAVAWLMLVVFDAPAPAEARAGCNHPWINRSGPASLLVALALLDPSTQPVTPEPALPQPGDRRGPCASGACSGSPILPAGPSIELRI